MAENKNITLVDRLKGLTNAIEFYTQKFDLEQVIQYAIIFVKELMDVDGVMAFANVDDAYKVVHQENFDSEPVSFPVDKALEEVIVFHAGLFFEDDLLRYLPEEVSEKYPCTLGIPLVMHKRLYGMILVNRNNHNGVFDSDDLLIASALMNLFYTSLTNYESFEELSNVQKALDEKIFNLFAINQSSKVLMGTLDIHTICEMSIGVFSELTQSAITSMFMYDEISEAYKLMSIQNVYKRDEGIGRVAYPSDDIVLMTKRSYYDMNLQEDRDAICRCFKNSELTLEGLEPRYVIPVNKQDHLLGFITLGKRVNENHYTEGSLELVESLSSSLYISISNALQYETIQQQKGEIDEKLQNLMTLNQMIKNINTSSDFDSLLRITRDTLNLSLNVECGLIASFNNEDGLFLVRETIECNDFTRILSLDKVVSKLKSGKIVVANSISEADDLLGSDITKHLKDKYAGALFIPVFLDKFEAELLGVICIFDIKDHIIVDQVGTLIYESVANAIAPVWHQLEQMERMKEHYVVNGPVAFKEQLVEEMKDSDDFDLELHVFMISYNSNNCLETDEALSRIASGSHKCHLIDSRHLMIISNVSSEIDHLKDDLAQMHSIRHLVYRENFDSYETLVKNL